MLHNNPRVLTHSLLGTGVLEYVSKSLSPIQVFIQIIFILSVLGGIVCRTTPNPRFSDSRTRVERRKVGRLEFVQ